MKMKWAIRWWLWRWCDVGSRRKSQVWEEKDGRLDHDESRGQGTSSSCPQQACMYYYEPICQRFRRSIDCHSLLFPNFDMKRVQASPPSQGSLPSNKKAKVGNKGLVQVGDGDDSTGEWTIVEKRKAKKLKKSESKFKVCAPWYRSETAALTPPYAVESTQVYVHQWGNY